MAKYQSRLWQNGNVFFPVRKSKKWCPICLVVKPDHKPDCPRSDQSQRKLILSANVQRSPAPWEHGITVIR